MKEEGRDVITCFTMILGIASVASDKNKLREVKKR